MKTLKHFLALFVVTLIVSSCSKSPEYKLCYPDEDGNIVVTELTTKDMLRGLKKANWPYTWDKETLKLTIGEIDEELEAFDEPVETMYAVEFKQCPGGIVVSKATMILGAHKIQAVLNNSDYAPTEYIKMRYNFAVKIWYYLGEYEK